MSDAFDVQSQCITFSWTPSSFTSLLLAGLAFVACHCWMTWRRGRSLGFLEGDDRWCAGLRLALNLCWHALIVEIMAKVRSSSGDSDLVYRVPLRHIALGQVMRCQSFIGLLLAIVEQPHPFSNAPTHKSVGLVDEGIKAHGLRRICRHSLFMSLFFFSLSFTLAPSALGSGLQGDSVYVSDIVYWGAHCAVSVGAIVMDELHMRRDALGKYDKLLAESSIVPRIDHIFSMTAMEMKGLVLRVAWSVVAVMTLYASSLRGFMQSACGGWLVNVYAMLYCTRQLLLEQMSQPWA
mmetsp:Transcript_70713/g.196681  ORF Transcript_70713/g.196681 Transcript_70713/m.196681 type:complete len:293 (-) Transcript_70713:455-1333(-)